jgi:ubiquinone/menaquinone biosynthesis C-methylase UbiE
MLPRILEPELMDTDEDAREYDAMDHAAVNAQFVTDLFATLAAWLLQRPGLLDTDILDLGAGTAQIPIELCQRAPHAHVTAVDAAESMLELAIENIADARLNDRIKPVLADAKRLPFHAESFAVVISNSIMHHIPEPRQVIAEALRVADPAGLQFHRDLARPHDESLLNHLVMTYAGAATPYQRKLFANSLRAALSLEEIRNLVAEFGFAPDNVQMTSDRHWTWSNKQSDT